MKIKNTISRRKRFVFLGLQFFFSIMVYLSSIATGDLRPSVESKNDGTLRVTIFPYLPRPEQFKTVISSAWAEIEPNVSLEFVAWDCYVSDPPPDLDVFVFDAIFLDDFQSKGYLSTISAEELTDPDDFLPYALDGCRSGGALRGIPNTICSSIFFYRNDDQALKDAKTLGEIAGVLKERTYGTLKPPPGKGLLVDLSNSALVSCLYIDALEDLYGAYTADPPLPPNSRRLDPWVIHNLQSLRKMASVKGAKSAYDPDNPAWRAAWFGQGGGRAFVDFPEALSAMGEEGRANVAFKLLPLSDRSAVSLVYVDVVAIGAATVANGRRTLALRLATLMSSSELMVKCIGPTDSNPCPQYVLPARQSVLTQMSQKFPLYGKMDEMMKEASPKPFRLGAGSREWIDSMKNQIKKEIFSNSGKYR